MTARISSFGAQSLAVAAMQARQVEMSHTQQQLASGSRLVAGRDDPVAAGVALALDRTQAELVRFGANADLLQHRLSLEESALGQAGDHLARVREIALQANSGIQSDETRRAFLAELDQHSDALLALANASDGQGRYLFGGTRDAAVPFARSGGAIVYAGDQNQRRVDVGPEQAVDDVDPGSGVFLRVPTGDGRVAARAEASNGGSALIKSAGFSDASAWDGGRYRIEFNGGNYTVLDNANSAVSSGTYVPGEAIDVRGYRLTLQGTPNDGDGFTVTPAPMSDVFATVQSLRELLATPAMPGAARQNALYASIEDLGRASDHFIDLRSGVGARLATLESSAEDRESQLLSVKTTLSSVRDLDYAEAIATLSRQSAGLEAAQASYLRIQQLSLFSRL